MRVKMRYGTNLHIRRTRKIVPTDRPTDKNCQFHFLVPICKFTNHFLSFVICFSIFSSLVWSPPVYTPKVVTTLDHRKSNKASEANN